MKRFLALMSLLLAGFYLSACDQKPQAFQNTDITGINYTQQFTLTDHTGKVRTLTDFKGKAVVLFFGFTQCPDVCPSTMAEMAGVMKTLGSQAEQVQVLFITIDPERDTKELLSQYVPAFDPRFIGLFGDKAATENAAKAFGIIYQKVLGKTPGSYSMDHSAGSFIVDPQGRLRLMVRNGKTADSIVHDLKILLHPA
ncbi:MAG: SCO family protein [Pseudomonadota bacterium]